MRLSVTILLCIFTLNVQAQDERFYRSIYSGALDNNESEPFEYKIEVSSDKYLIDLNRDNKKDSIQTIKRDGVDFFRINDEYGKNVFEAKLETKGRDSKIFRVSFKTISPTIDVLLLHFYEGHNEAAVFEGSARLYIVTIKNRNFKEISMTKGTFFWSEKAGISNKYWARRYTVNTVDLNKDGQKEISVSFNNIDRIYYYSTKSGSWQMF